MDTLVSSPGCTISLRTTMRSVECSVNERGWDVQLQLHLREREDADPLLQPRHDWRCRSWCHSSAPIDAPCETVRDRRGRCDIGSSDCDESLAVRGDREVERTRGRVDELACDGTGEILWEGDDEYRE
jgi:hypothetical protein